MSPSTLLVPGATCRREVGAFTLCLPLCQPPFDFYFELRFGLGRPPIDWSFDLSLGPLGFRLRGCGLLDPVFRSVNRSSIFMSRCDLGPGRPPIDWRFRLSFGPLRLRRRGMLLIGDQVSVVNIDRIFFRHSCHRAPKHQIPNRFLTSKDQRFPQPPPTVPPFLRGHREGPRQLEDFRARDSSKPL